MIILFPATYDSVDLVEVVATMPRKLLYLVRGLDDTPGVRGANVIVPRAMGQVPRNRVWDSRTIELAGFLGGVGTNPSADMRVLLEEMRELFDPTRDPAELSVTLEDGGTATIQARPLNMIVPASLAPVRDGVSIELEAVEGDWAITPASS